MLTNDRYAYRQAFYTAWQKYCKNLPLEPVEIQMAEIIVLHPEYHFLFEKETSEVEFQLEENPYLHLSLHLAIQDQIRLDMPKGITKVYQELLKRGHVDSHGVQHQMMLCLANFIWQIAQSSQNATVNEAAYLEALQAL